MNQSHERGQVLLAVILVAVVALTIGLSLVSRSITNVKVATQSEESQRAFQAAEAGVQRALEAIELSPTPPTAFQDTLSNKAEFDTSVRIVEGSEIALNGGYALEQDIGSDVWLSQYPTYANPVTGDLTLYFADPGQSQCSGSGENVTPALEIMVLTGNITSPTFTKYVVDPCTRIVGAVSASAGGTVSGRAYRYSYQVPVAGGLVARVVPIYNNSIAAVTSSVVLPSQGSVVESVGSSGESVRKVIVFKSHPQVPVELFQYAILSQ